MIIGIGMDLVEIARIQRAYERTSIPFIKRILTNKEMKNFDALETEKRKIEWVSGRLAAKEAFVKAIGKGFGDGLKCHDIEIVSTSEGRPAFRLSDRLRADYEANTIFHLSITHTAQQASAFVIAEEIKSAECCKDAGEVFSYEK